MLPKKHMIHTFDFSSLQGEEQVTVGTQLPFAWFTHIDQGVYPRPFTKTQKSSY